MLCAKLACASSRAAEDNRYVVLSARHGVHFSRCVDNRIDCYEREIECHEFNNGANAVSRSAYTYTSKTQFRNGGINYPIRSEFIEHALADLVRATYIQQAIENPSRAAELAGKAAVQLDLAAKIRETPEVNANLASVALMNKNPYKAANYANKALNGASNDVARGVNGVKGSSEIYIGKYDAAVRSESSALTTDVNLFNKGLAQLLTKDYASAENSFSEATKNNSNLAIAYYGAAIAGARSGNADKVVSNLTNAVRIDPTLKEMALTDLEFSKFNTSEAFRSALK